MRPSFKSRSVQEIGNSWFISLPIDWINHHGIRTKDRLSIHLDDEDNLIVNGKKNEKII